MPAIARSALLPLLMLGGCSAEPPAAPGSRSSVNYSAVDIYELEFMGLRLGMGRDEVCTRLVGQGFTNDSPGGCGPLAPRDYHDEPPGDSFDGSAPGVCDPQHCRPDSPAATVQFISLEYERAGGRDLLRKIYAWTAEPGGRAALSSATIRDWGPPTFLGEWGYTMMLYAASAEQADYLNRNQFDRCRHNPGCAEQDGVDCGAVLTDLATPYARATVYEGFRVIEVEDPRPYLRELRAAGDLRGREFVPNYVCMVAPIH